jgi:hypothetical protein
MAECRAVSDVAMGLHMVWKFTDAWGGDGSKGEWRTEDGKHAETRVGCGVYEGVQPGGTRHGEEIAAAEARAFGAGVRCMRLPACYEVVDAELHAILLALRTTARREAAHERRCLIVSDCISALRMCENAWRRGVAWQGQRAGRAGLLHAINCEREKLAAAIMMWAPAHRGGSVSAYADAAAKAGTAAVRDGDAHLQQVQQWLPSDRCAIVVREPEGWSLWPTNRHTAYRDAIGWWVLRRMTRGGRAGRTVDPQRAEAPWTVRAIARWDPVWEGTGARAAAAKSGQREEGGEGRRARKESTGDAEGRKRGRAAMRDRDGCTRRGAVGSGHARREARMPSVLLEEARVALARTDVDTHVAG